MSILIHFWWASVNNFCKAVVHIKQNKRSTNSYGILAGEYSALKSTNAKNLQVDHLLTTGDIFSQCRTYRHVNATRSYLHFRQN